MSSVTNKETQLGPLDGINVVDLSSVVMGPLCTQILADHGATVYKIERLEGDTTRWIGPSRTPGMGPMFLHLNHGKRSISLDLKDERCKAIVRRLILKADVVVHNLRPKAIERLGFGFNDVSAINPTIVYCGLYGYGQNGPYSSRPAYDDLIQGAAALPDLQGRISNQGPQFVNMNVADRMVGLSAAYAISMGLLARHRTGKPQKIDVPMFETLASQVLSDHLFGRTHVPATDSAGYPRLLSPDRRPYKTTNGFICVAVYTDMHWRKFLPSIGREDLLSDPVYSSLNSRMKNAKTVTALLGSVIASNTSEHWESFFDALDIPIAPLNTIDSLIDDPHIREVALVAEREHPTEGKVKHVRSPILWDDRLVLTGDAPQLGQHTEETMLELGYRPEEIQSMVDDQIVRRSR